MDYISRLFGFKFNDKQEPVPVPEGLIITLLHCFKNDVPVDSKQKVTIEDVP